MKISVIIPTLNEENFIAQTLNSVATGVNIEYIIVDGGSKDKTIELALNAGARVIQSEQGRSTQMNKGASFASGDALLFLHADTILPHKWDSIIRAVLNDSNVSLGAFRFKVKENIKGMQWVEWGTNLRSKVFGMPYGDQGLFLKQSLFQVLGGYPEIPILEDVKLIKKAKKYGRIITTSEAAITSGRRWQKVGVVKTTLYNQLILLGDLLGISQITLLKFYAKNVKI